MIRVYVNQHVCPVLVALPAHQVLMPERRRITIRRQSGGGPLQLPRSSGTRWSSSRQGSGSSRENGVWGVPRRVREGRRAVRVRGDSTGGAAPWDRGPGREPRRERPSRITDRPSAFQAGDIPSWRGSCERYPLSPVAAGSCWLVLLLSSLLSAAWFGSSSPRSPGCHDRALPCPRSQARVASRGPSRRGTLG